MSRKNCHGYVCEKEKHLATGLIELGNLSIAALIFGQAYGGIPFNFSFALLGISIFVLLYYSATIILKEHNGH